MEAKSRRFQGEVSCVKAEDQVLAIEVQQCNKIQLLPLQLFENNEDHSSKTKRAISSMKDYINQELQIQREALEQVETSFILCWEWSE